AALDLLKEKGMENVIHDTYKQCIEEIKKEDEKITNCTRALYARLTADEISAKIVELLKPADLKADLEIIFQSMDGLHQACPAHPGDWYFSGNYPTAGGNKMANIAYIEYYESKILKK
ncbi:MAG: amidophosphoribosyltransferase, partial [Bacteroidaceae bacterium]|nr:amidophosphoribosyltransferase [Bacteroidaceae bacterium]